MKLGVFIGLILTCCFATELQAQKVFKNIKKHSTAKNTLWGYWGYNRSVYSKSDITFRGRGYDFTLKGSRASDNPSKKFSEYVDLAKITVPQFNARVGYYYKDHYSISLGYDHMKYLFNDANDVLIDGYVNPGIDSTWSGIYQDARTVTNRKNFHYENSNGLNYIRFELTRSDKFYQSKNKWVALVSNFSLGTGCVLTISDFNFAGKFDRYVASISGYGFSGHVSLRLEFFRHFFIQPELSGGRINLSKVHLRKDDDSAVASHKFWYGQRNITAGFLLYLKPQSGCQDCPVW